MKNVLKVLLIMVLTMAFAFSCSNSDENPFAESYLYCVNSVAKTCVPGVFKECPSGAVPKDVCPAEFAEKASSSSSRGSSSSGVGDNDPFAGIPEWEYYKETLKYYYPDDGAQRCRNGVVEERCEVDGNEVWYNPLTLTHTCSCWDLGEENSGCRFETLERCGNQLYRSYDGRCLNGVVEERCGYSENETWFNPETHYCDLSVVKAKERCGSKYYYPNSSGRCQNGVAEVRCGYGENNETWYNPETHYCDWSTGTAKAIELCGIVYVSSRYQRCNNGVFEEECGHNENATWYNPITQSCDWGTSTVKAKQRCGS